MKIKTAAVLLVATLTLALSGCGQTAGVESGSGNAPVNHYTFWQELPDGARVMCVWAKDGRGGGLSCNWNDVKE